MKEPIVYWIANSEALKKISWSISSFKEEIENLELLDLYFENKFKVTVIGEKYYISTFNRPVISMKLRFSGVDANLTKEDCDKFEEKFKEEYSDEIIKRIKELLVSKNLYYLPIVSYNIYGIRCIYEQDHIDIVGSKEFEHSQKGDFTITKLVNHKNLIATLKNNDVTVHNKEIFNDFYLDVVPVEKVSIKTDFEDLFEYIKENCL